jgi:integrase/recombinase XerD
VDGCIGPHKLRYWFATFALDNGAALHDLQDSLGQADPRTTWQYDRSRRKLAKSAGYDVA